ncbi:MAG: hypothetical protein ACRD6W_09465, partial [Nitrososphaerales archaeon]
NYTTHDTSSTLSNAAYATTATGGALNIYNSTSTANIVVDEFGYFAPETTAATTGSVIAISPTSGPGGTTVTPTVSNPSSVSALSVSGCGLTDQSLTAPNYTFSIPVSETAGTCTLTFTGTANSNAVTSTDSFNVTGTIGPTGFVNAISPTTGPAGSSITLTVTNPNSVNAESVTGCGFPTGGTAIFKNISGNFALTIPSSQAAGPCTMTFVSTNNDGSPSQTSAATFTVNEQVTPGTLTTSAPDLVSAGILTNGNGTTTPSIVQYVFDKPVLCGPASTAGPFTGKYPNLELMAWPTDAFNTDVNFIGVPSAINMATSCTGAPGNADAVNVTFPAGVVATDYTLAVAQNGSPLEKATAPVPGAVIGTQPGNGNGLYNPLGSVALSGSAGFSGATTPGVTQGPQLLSVSVIDSNTAVFTFNTGIGACTPGGFYFWQTSGAPPFPNTGGTCTATGNPQVTVNWAGTAGAGLVTGAALFANTPVAVTSQNNGFPGPEGTAPGPVTALGSGVTGAPQLTQVASTPNPDVFNFTFDKPVDATSVTAAGLHAFLLY